MNKRFLLFLSLTLMLIPSYVFAFSDIEGHWAEAVITNWNNKEVINGYQDGTFKPDNPMTRAELVTVIDRLIGIQSESDKYISDVTSKDWYYSNFRKAMCFGIIQGDDNGNVNPNNNVTREETVLIISRALGLESDDAYFNSSFDDANDISTWARKEFISFVRKQYISGYNDNTLKPKKDITRAEILTILNRIIKNFPESMYLNKLTGLTLIREKALQLNNVEIFGDLIIGEDSIKTIKLTNVIINGNLVLYAPLDLEKNSIMVNGKIINIYENKELSDSYYINENYGITFPIPKGANAFTSGKETSNDYSKNDLIIVSFDKNDEYYFKGISELSKGVTENLKSDSIFKKVSDGKINDYPYEVYTDNITTYLIMIKRDNLVYEIMLLNTVSDNIIDNIISNIKFTRGLDINNHENVIYRNSKLALKFNYKNGYVGVDDSYNTGIVYSGDSMFKLFIQVNMITDIDDYSISEVKTLLRSLIKNDGKIVEENVFKINNHNAIEFHIESDEDKTISLYVIIGQNLYNFIFKGKSFEMDNIGNEMFSSIVNSMEF